MQGLQFLQRFVNFGRKVVSQVCFKGPNGNNYSQKDYPIEQQPVEQPQEPKWVRFEKWCASRVGKKKKKLCESRCILFCVGGVFWDLWFLVVCFLGLF
jgi:hypothetical protein